MKTFSLKLLSFLIFTTLFFASCNDTKVEEPTPDWDFTFVFMTDIHLTEERNAVEGFKKAIDTVNKLQPDFVITGGDNIMDAFKQTFVRSDSLFNLYLETSKLIESPLYNSIGNHDLYGVVLPEGVERNEEYYNTGLYEKKIGEPYHKFQHKNWHFFSLNSIKPIRDVGYIGYIDEVQEQWIISELQNIDKNDPIVIISHIPFYTTTGQIRSGSTAGNDSSHVVVNASEILAHFEGYNLTLILQGHIHMREDILLMDRIRFMLGGAVSANWWRGPRESYGLSLQEGFLLFRVKGNHYEYEYIDYLWDAPVSE